MHTLTNERFESSGLTIFQPARGHRYGRESLTLAAFVNDCKGQRVCELGSGVGVISLQIAVRHKPASVTAVEIQQTLHDIALKNVHENNLARTVTCINGDIRTYAQAHIGRFDVVVTNPPFFPAANGRLSPDAQRAVARHELNGTIADFIQAARTLLVHRGRFFVVFDKRRQDELSNAARTYGFEAVRTEAPPVEAYVLVEFSVR